jgi:hypothetical protein
VFVGVLDEDERREDEAARVAVQAERHSLEAAERPLIDYFEQVEDLARSALFASGFHQHKRQWRRRRVRRQED